MKYNQYKTQGTIWIYPGDAAWHFVTIPGDISKDIKHLFGDRARGWGSLPVQVSLNETSWKTSIFPDKKIGAYILPLKKEVRNKERLHSGDSIQFLIEILIS